MLGLGDDRQKVVKYPHTYLSDLRVGYGSRSKCCSQYSRKSALVPSRLYRGALGNRQAWPVKRFWTGDLYCWASNGQGQACWSKEEPLAISGGGGQRA